MTDLPASLSPVKKAYLGFPLFLPLRLEPVCARRKGIDKRGKLRVKTVFGGDSRKGSQLILVAPTWSSMSLGASISGAVPEFL